MMMVMMLTNNSLYISHIYDVLGSNKAVYEYACLYLCMCVCGVVAGLRLFGNAKLKALEVYKWALFHCSRSIVLAGDSAGGSSSRSGSGSSRKYDDGGGVVGVT